MCTGSERGPLNAVEYACARQATPFETCKPANEGRLQPVVGSPPGPDPNLAAARQHSRCQGASGPTADVAGMVAPDPNAHRSRADCELILQIAAASPLQLKRQDLSGPQQSQHFGLADLLLRLSGGGCTRRRRH